jgi:hypothetical protein
MQQDFWCCLNYKGEHATKPEHAHDMCGRHGSALIHIHSCSDLCVKNSSFPGILSVKLQTHRQQHGKQCYDANDLAKRGEKAVMQMSWPQISAKPQITRKTVEVNIKDISQTDVLGT